MARDYWHDYGAEDAAAEEAKIPVTESIANNAAAEIPAAGSETAVPQPADKLNLERAYDLDVLNTDSNYPIQRIESGLKNFANQLQNGTNRVQNCCLLFYGAPGTGKTEFGKYLASKIDFDFLVRRGSDLLGEYVGQTEHAIKNLFDEAEKRRAIVMIDEADTFLRNRSLSQREYELSMTNELLCRMEEFRGIFICSTNLLNIFDPASLRRFIFKIHFQPLNDAGKELICRKMMHEVCDLPDDLSALRTLHGLTPGNFRTVRDRLLILNENHVSFEELLRELKLELSLSGAEQKNGKTAEKAPSRRTKTPKQ